LLRPPERRVRQALEYPSLDAARAALGVPGDREAERCAPVDPDAIVLTSPPIPDRLR